MHGGNTVACQENQAKMNIDQTEVGLLSEIRNARWFDQLLQRDMQEET